MNSRERFIRSLEGRDHDYPPLICWCFGFKPDPSLLWNNSGGLVNYWYTMRLEHIHTLPIPWSIEDDFKRVEKWQELGVDDILDVSVPWGIDDSVKVEDKLEKDEKAGCILLIRNYFTPAGRLEHVVKKTGEKVEPGWVIQPNFVPLFEDYNIPRAVKHAVSGVEDIERVRFLYRPPDKDTDKSFKARMEKVSSFAKAKGVPVQAWSAFGMDAVVWLCGVEGSIFMAMDNENAFQSLVETIFETDYARTELACQTDVDIIVQRGWYSSTDFWSPELFNKFCIPFVQKLSDLVHNYKKKFAYVVTTGVEIIGPELVEAGVDLIYFIDPVQDKITLERAVELFGGRVAVAGGINTTALSKMNKSEIEFSVERALRMLGGSGRFILQPVDALFPDTPWEKVKALIDSWKKYRSSW